MASSRCFWPLCATSAPTFTITGTPCGSQNSAWMSSAGSRCDLVDVDAVVHHVDLRRRECRRATRMSRMAPRRGDEARHLAILPARERVAAQVKVDAPRRDQRRRRSDGAERQRRRRHRHRMRIVRVHDVGPVVADDARQPPRRAQVDLVARRQPTRSGPFGGALVQLTLRVRDEHRPVPAFAQAEDGQEACCCPPRQVRAVSTWRLNTVPTVSRTSGRRSARSSPRRSGRARRHGSRRGARNCAEMPPADAPPGRTSRRVRPSSNIWRAASVV